MALLPEGKYENLKRSVDAYLSTALTTAFEGNVHYEGEATEDQLASATWVEPTLLGPARPSTGVGREIRHGVRAQEIIPIIQVNIFCRPSRALDVAGATILHRMQQLRDAVVDVLHEGLTIPVYDYASGPYTGGGFTQLGVLKLEAVSMDQAVPVPESDQDLKQWTYSINSRWIELYSV